MYDPRSIDPVTRAPLTHALGVPLRKPKVRRLTPEEAAAVKSLIEDSGYSRKAARAEVLSFGAGPR